MRIKSTILILLLLLSTFTSTVNAELVERIVAIVNEDIITLSELNDEGHTYFQAIMKNVPTQHLESEMQKARQEVLDQLIERLLIRQQADRFDLVITEEDIDKTIDSILMENNLSVADFKNDLQKRGGSEEVYRQKLKSQLLRSRLINILIRSKIVISDEKANDYYNDYYSSNSNTISGYHIAQMGFLWGDKFKSKTQDEAMQKAEFVRKKLLEGEEFAALAKNYSDLPSAEDGGDIGIFKEDELAPYMQESILHLKPGETTQIIQTPAGLQILKLLSAKSSNSTPPDFDSVREEIKDLLFRQEMEKNYEQWISDIRAKSYIKQNL